MDFVEIKINDTFSFFYIIEQNRTEQNGMAVNGERKEEEERMNESQVEKQKNKTKRRAVR
jgi:hypothetical protein